MATGLAITLKSGAAVPERYWRTIIDYPAESSAVGEPIAWAREDGDGDNR